MHDTTHPQRLDHQQRLIISAEQSLGRLSSTRAGYFQPDRGVFVLLGSLSSDSTSPGENQEGRVNY